MVEERLRLRVIGEKELRLGKMLWLLLLFCIGVKCSVMHALWGVSNCSCFACALEIEQYIDADALKATFVCANSRGQYSLYWMLMCKRDDSSTRVKSAQ